ncbi:MAG: RidA family protein [Fermentimonas sp.]|jgi:2-iminobutanoate/2-iminopropanoate deaminase
MKKRISTDKAPAAIGPYSQAIMVNNIIYLSGMLPIDPSTGNFAEGGVKVQTSQIFDNIKEVLAEADADFGNVVKTTVYLSDMAFFSEMNEVYAKQFAEPFPARTTIAVKALPKDALVEIEVIAVK